MAREGDAAGVGAAGDVDVVACRRRLVDRVLEVQERRSGRAGVAVGPEGLTKRAWRGSLLRRRRGSKVSSVGQQRWTRRPRFRLRTEVNIGEFSTGVFDEQAAFRSDGGTAPPQPMTCDTVNHGRQGARSR